jgi:non-homologous end joining protein Ku
MAKSLVRNLALNTFAPHQYRDEYRTALVQLVNVKVDGPDGWCLQGGGGCPS